MSPSPRSAGPRSAALRYAAASAATIATILLALWPFLDPTDRSGVLVAAAIAVPVQILAFAFLVRARGQANRFLAAWAGGTAARMVLVAVVAFVAIRSGAEGAVAMLLALAGFLFALLLLEPIYFKPGPDTLAETVEV